LLPILICDPRSGLTQGQYFNPNCFASPLSAHLDASGNFVPGVNGKPVWPYIHGPLYMNHDLSIYKNFKFHESKGVQFRVNAFNFLNHPLPQFGLNNDLNLSLASAPIDGAGGYTVPTSCKVDTQTDPHLGCNGNGTTNGKPFGKVGRRVMEFAVKFTF